jgi:eukaryotic-like serine/threonine-protein kinase
MIQPAIPSQIGTYRVLSQFVTNGAIATVYLVEDVQGNRYALKRLNELWTGYRSLRNEFTDEANRLIELNFPTLIKGHELVLDSGEPFFTMELATETLQDSLLRQRNLPTEEVLRILESVGLAIDFLREKGLAHQDVKPSNIFRFLVDGRWSTKLGDLGLTRNFEFTLTRAGSAPYAAVEVLDGRTGNYPPAIRSRADIYSLAVIAAELLTGSYVSFHFRAPGAWAANLPESVGEVLLRGMNNEPTERQSCAAEFVADLRCAVAVEQPKGEVVGEGVGA